MNRLDTMARFAEPDEEERQQALANDIDEMSEEDYTAFYFEDDDRYEMEYIHEVLYEAI